MRRKGTIKEEGTHLHAFYRHYTSDKVVEIEGNSIQSMLRVKKDAESFYRRTRLRAHFDIDPSDRERDVFECFNPRCSNCGPSELASIDLFISKCRRDISNVKFMTSNASSAILRPLRNRSDIVIKADEDLTLDNQKIVKDTFNSFISDGSLPPTAVHSFVTASGKENLKFARESITDYISVRRNLPSMERLTICLWTRSPRSGTIISYAVPENTNEIFVDYMDKKFSVHIGHKVWYSRVGVYNGYWNHICATWDNSAGQIVLYKDGFRRAQGIISKGHVTRSRAMYSSISPQLTQ
ncbi:Neuronal pentraxin-1 [Exaiptasia diaphana]|nr:Neuronal pentraxin-1 [Exaiptasia diaphana]